MFRLPAYSDFRFFQHGFIAHDNDHAALAHLEALLIRFQIVSNFGVLGQAYVPVDNRVANFRVAPDADVIIENGIFHFAITIYANVGADDRAYDAATGNYAAGRNNRVDRCAHAVGIVENKFRRRILLLLMRSGQALS